MRISTTGAWFLVAGAMLAQGSAELSVRSHRLTAEFIAEGADAGDFDGDGHVDIVAGFRVWMGPSFEVAKDFGPARTFDRQGYSNAFFNFVEDLDRDGDLDVLVVGFPGEAAEVLRNRGVRPLEFERATVFRGVDNESPAFADLTGDGQRELVCQHAGVIGYVAYDPAKLLDAWTFRPISEAGQGGKFSHGLGVGDVTGDGRPDVLTRNGIWEAPEDPLHEVLWVHHAVPLAHPGGAQMLVADFDGDGHTEIITSVHAHGYGLRLWERDAQSPVGWRAHELMTHRTLDREDELSFGGLHALALADMDGDGKPDFVTGNRAWSHGGADAADHDPAYLTWWRVRKSDGRWSSEAVVLNRESGVGVQVVVRDVDSDGRTDIVVASKNGVFVHFQTQPPPSLGATEKPRGEWPRRSDGSPANLGFETGDLSDWTSEGDAFAKHPVQGDRVRARRGDMASGHRGRFWAGSYESGRADDATGHLISAPFVVTHDYGAFFVGGGARADVGVDLLLRESGTVIATARGRDVEDLHQVVVSLSEHRGKEIQLRLRDDAKGHWGHINFDDFRWYETAPRGAELIGRERTPKEAAQAMEVPPGFRVDVIAAEPDLHQPIAMAFDERGRIYVAEAHSYPQKRGPGKGLDRVVVFSDADGDGSFETRRVFIEGLDLVSGLEVGFGGVWIGAAPELLFIPDRDRDLVPDGPAEVILNGWGYQDTHETLNSFVWGEDGWLWGTHGVFTHSRVGPPGCAEADRVPINAGVWRFDPRTRRFEVVAHGTSNPWGLDFDADGEALIEGCVIPHLWHIVPGGRYQRQAGSHFDAWVSEDLPTIADHVHWIGDTPHSGNGRSNDAGGGHAHCGLVVVQSPAWPAWTQGLVLMGNIHGNRIVADRVEPRASTYQGRHHGDFLLAHDPAFRLIAMRFGPDGHLYFIDWYDRQACHRTETEIWDRTNGRLYRLASESRAGYAPISLPDDQAPLVQVAIEDPSVWTRRHARQQLAERGVPSTLVEHLWKIAQTEPANTSARAVRLLHAVGAELRFEHLALASNLPERSRAALARWLADSPLARGDSIAPLVLAWARPEASAVVVRELVSLLPRLSSTARSALTPILITKTECSADSHLQKLAWFILGGEVQDATAEAIGWIARSQWPEWTRLGLRRLLEGPRRSKFLDGLQLEAWAPQNRLALFSHLLALAGETRGLPLDAGLAKLLEQGEEDPDPAVSDLAAQLMRVLSPSTGELRLEDLARPDQPLLQRRRLLREALSRRDSVGLDQTYRHLADPGLRPLILDNAARHPDPSVTQALLASLPNLDAIAEREVIRVLVSRRPSAESFVAWAETSERRHHLDDPVVRSSLQLLGIAQNSSASSVTAVASAGSRAERVQAWLDVLERLPSGRPPEGRSVFVKTCMPCHRLFDVGGEVGPDLTGSQRHDAAYVLANLLDPSAEVAAPYQVTTVETTDGRMLDGILERRDSEGVILKSAGGREVILVDEIAREPDGSLAVHTSPLSMMPNDLLERVSAADLRDLLAYLGSRTQTGLAADARVAPWFPPLGGLGFWTQRVGAEVNGSSIVLRTRGEKAAPASIRSDMGVTSGVWRGTAQILGGGARLTIGLTPSDPKEPTPSLLEFAPRLPEPTAGVGPDTVTEPSGKPIGWSISLDPRSGRVIALVEGSDPVEATFPVGSVLHLLCQLHGKVGAAAVLDNLKLLGTPAPGR